MNHLPRFLIVLILAWSGIGTNSVHAASIQTVFDNTVNSFFSGNFGPSCCQIGNEIALGGNAREIIQLAWQVDTQDTDIIAGLETRIYANNGIGGAPGTLLYNSGPIVGLPVSASDSFLYFSFPPITVPDIITATLRIFDSTPLALGWVSGGPPSVGSFITSWTETSPGVWVNGFGPIGLRVLAVVPEPSTVSLMITVGIMLIGFCAFQSQKKGGKSCLLP